MSENSELDKIISQNVLNNVTHAPIHNQIVQNNPMSDLQPNYLSQLHHVATNDYATLDDMFEAYLQVGYSVLGVNVGLISHIDGDTYHIQSRFPHQAHNNSYSLKQMMCQYVVAGKATVLYNNLSLLDPSPKPEGDFYDHIECYIGTPIMVGDAIWGTICFHGDESGTLTQLEIEFVEMMAYGISNALTQQFSERQQRLAERRYRLIFENIDIPILIYDVETYAIFDVNPTATQFYGYSREEFLELTMLDINMMPQADIEVRLLQSQASGLPFTRFPHRLKEGDIRDVEDYSTEMMIEDQLLRFSIIYDYSERHASEEALKRSEANLRAIFDNASQLMFLVDGTSNIIAMNRAAGEMIQTISGEPLQMTGNTTLGFYPKADRYLVSKYINRALEGHSNTYDMRMIVNDEPRYITYRYVPVKTPDGTVIGVCVTGQDITSIKLSEEKLAYERNILRALIDNLPDAIYIKDDDARLLTANQRYLDMARAISTEAILGKNDIDIYPEYGEAYYQDDVYVLNNNVILNKDEPVILPDNSKGIFETTKIPLQDEEGQVIGLVGVGRDITTQREIEQGLRDNEEKFHQLITHIPEAFWIYDLESRDIVYASENYEHVFGISAKEQQHDIHKFMAQVHPDDHHLVQEGFQRQSAGFETIYEARFMNGGNVTDIRWLNIRIYPVLNDEHEVYRVAGIASDVTEEKRARETMLDMMAQEERINILSTFFRDASHEFRTPLSVINTSLYVLKKSDDADKQQTHLDLIQSQVRGLSELVEMLVLMSRLDSGADITLMALNMSSILKPFTQTFADVYPARKNDLKVSLRQSLPLILGNRSYIVQAVRNLIDNAVRYSEPGSPIYLKTYAKDALVIVEIEDRGTGISDTEFPRIFQRFYRGDEAHSTRGFGLGLTIAQSIVQRHGGDIQVKTRFGYGSKFTLSFPGLQIRND